MQPPPSPSPLEGEGGVGEFVIIRLIRLKLFSDHSPGRHVNEISSFALVN